MYVQKSGQNATDKDSVLRNASNIAIFIWIFWKALFFSLNLLLCFFGLEKEKISGQMLRMV